MGEKPGFFECDRSSANIYGFNIIVKSRTKPGKTSSSASSTITKGNWR
ncbi:hypothetical protein [Brunnivagina elsteri]|nr:hypothetical protein [Calothrix elsteri]